MSCQASFSRLMALACAVLLANSSVAHRRAGPQTPKTKQRNRDARLAAIPAPFPGQPAFKHRGFYFHCGWAFRTDRSPLAHGRGRLRRGTSNCCGGWALTR